MSQTPSTPMRRDIQALRGLAVLAVLAFHYKIGGVLGGFLGVDIFFVISGFVITKRVIKYQGSLPAILKDFYLRRAKRLLPTSLLVIGVTAILARLTLPALSLGELARESLATALFVPNFFFAHLENNYLSQGVDPSPYLHYWSLGVEEQFYLLWPLLLILILRKKLAGVALALGLAIISMLTLGQRNSVTAFYQPWFRSWELLAGALIALTPPLTHRAPAIALGTLGWCGALGSLLFIGVNHPDPGVTTLIPVASTCFIIASNLGFSWRIGLVSLGDISYSLYLIHWPLLILLLSHYPNMDSCNRLGLAIVALALSFLVSRYFEKPLRRSQKIMKLRSFVLPVLLVSFLSFGVLNTGASASTPALTISRATPIIYDDGCHLAFGQFKPKAGCFFGDTRSSTIVILVGDSHAAMHFPGLNLLAKNKHWKLLALTKSSCPPAQLQTIRANHLDSSCAIWERNLPSLFQRYKARYIFLGGSSEEGYRLAKGSPSYAQGFTLTLDAALASGALPVLLSDTPYPGSDSPACLIRNLGNFSVCDLTPPHSVATRDVAAIAHMKGVIVFKPESYLCANGRCPAVFNKGNVYRDSSHISVATSLRLEPVIARELESGASGRD